MSQSRFLLHSVVCLPRVRRLEPDEPLEFERIDRSPVRGWNERISNLDWMSCQFGKEKVEGRVQSGEESIFCPLDAIICLNRVIRYLIKSSLSPHEDMVSFESTAVKREGSSSSL